MSDNSTIIPELAVTDFVHSLQFYRDILGFSVLYQRPEEGFAMLALHAGRLMIDQSDIGRTFGIHDTVLEYPYGRGVNLQIEVPEVTPLLQALEIAGIALYLPLEEKWYRMDRLEIGQRQFIVPDPDGYLLRFCQRLGTRAPLERR